MEKKLSDMTLEELWTLFPVQLLTASGCPLWVAFLLDFVGRIRYDGKGAGFP